MALSSPTTAVEKLHVADNALGSAGAEVLAKLIASQAKLRELHAAQNAICGPWGKQCAGVRALAGALAESASLELLDLSANSIGTRDAGSMELWVGPRPTCAAVYLVEALKINTSLRRLTLSSNLLVGEQGQRLAATWQARGSPVDGLRL